MFSVERLHSLSIIWETLLRKKATSTVHEHFDGIKNIIFQWISNHSAEELDYLPEVITKKNQNDTQGLSEFFNPPDLQQKKRLLKLIKELINAPDNQDLLYCLILTLLSEPSELSEPKKQVYFDLNNGLSSQTTAHLKSKKPYTSRTFSELKISIINCLFNRIEKDGETEKISQDPFLLHLLENFYPLISENQDQFNSICSLLENIIKLYDNHKKAHSLSYVDHHAKIILCLYQLDDTLFLSDDFISKMLLCIDSFPLETLETFCEQLQEYQPISYHFILTFLKNDKKIKPDKIEPDEIIDTYSYLCTLNIRQDLIDQLFEVASSSQDNMPLYKIIYLKKNRLLDEPTITFFLSNKILSRNHTGFTYHRIQYEEEKLENGMKEKALELITHDAFCKINHLLYLKHNNSENFPYLIPLIELFQHSHIQEEKLIALFELICQTNLFKGEIQARYLFELIRDHFIYEPNSDKDRLVSYLLDLIKSFPANLPPEKTELYILALFKCPNRGTASCFVEAVSKLSTLYQTGKFDFDTRHYQVILDHCHEERSILNSRVMLCRKLILKDSDYNNSLFEFVFAAKAEDINFYNEKLEDHDISQIIKLQPEKNIGEKLKNIILSHGIHEQMIKQINELDTHLYCHDETQYSQKRNLASLETSISNMNKTLFLDPFALKREISTLIEHAQRSQGSSLNLPTTTYFCCFFQYTVRNKLNEMKHELSL